MRVTLWKPGLFIINRAENKRLHIYQYFFLLVLKTVGLLSIFLWFLNILYLSLFTYTIYLVGGTPMTHHFKTLPLKWQRSHRTKHLRLKSSLWGQFSIHDWSLEGKSQVKTQVFEGTSQVKTQAFECKSQVNRSYSKPLDNSMGTSATKRRVRKVMFIGMFTF